MNKKIVDEVYKKLNDLYQEKIAEINKICVQNNVGGRIRAMSGHLGEDLSELAWSEIGKYYVSEHNIKFETIKGDHRKIQCVNENGNSIDMQVDRHQYINGELVHIEECKSYLDRCYLIRASDDCRLIREYAGSVSTSVLAFEDSVKKESYDFIMDEGHVDNVYFLTDGKRNSKKPIWKKQHFKPLNKNKVKEYVDNIISVFDRCCL
mgnify:CR=1 FL=1|tara:strand:- start:604 stop:1224 length:621 start_codon:yes stop_codon:yes gene_type:complete